MSDSGKTGDLLPSAFSAYGGSAWRARFLRSPKIALELAARADFAPLKALASVKLGLKTGADSFFFVERMETEKERELISRRGVVIVKGLDGWRGEVSISDLKPAALNPHQMFEGDNRLFAVPELPKHYYVYPRAGKLRFGLSEYIKLGELKAVHEGDLVKSNVSDVGWYRQARSLVTSEWLLPYNSALDYGAWHNSNGFILNGRFVGVEPLERNSSELLGAVLNSTFAVVGRLIEGVATGVEGAFDVGPPAARRIMLPDYRHFNESGAANALKVFSEIRKRGHMLPAPSRTAEVHRLRHDLDASLLIALGLTKGQAAALLERLYESYARWRANIEDVETQMRANRRQMNVTGQNRNQKPAEVTGKRVWEEIEHQLPLYPKQFLTKDEVMELVNVPATAEIPETEQLFDSGVIHHKNKALDLGSFDRVRYVAMLRTIGVVGSVEVPTSSKRARAICDLFEQDRTRFDNLAAEHAAKYVSGVDAISEVVNVARKHWYSANRKNALAKPEKEKRNTKLN